VMWEAEVEPTRFAGGNCQGCPYQLPDVMEKQPKILIEFLQRAYMRITFADGSWQYMVPLLFGDHSRAFFTEQTPYVFPLIKPNPWGSLWTIVFKAYSDDEFAPWTWSSGVFEISEGEMPDTGPDAGKLRYRVWEPTSPPEVIVPFGRIYCDLDLEEVEPVCTFVVSGIDPVTPVEFRISIGNFTDSRFFGISESKDIVQGFRLQYD
jgi:hypothetical protein